MRRALLCLCCLGLVASVALADGPIPNKATANEVSVPVRVASLNYDWTVSKWRDGSGASQRGDYTLVFDCFEPITDAQGNATDRPARAWGFETCGSEDGSNNEQTGDPATGRYQLVYTNPPDPNDPNDYVRDMYSTNDMNFDPAYGGEYTARLEVGWAWIAYGAGSSELCAIVIETYEGWDENCAEGDGDDPNDPNGGQGAWLGGVILWFGDIPGGAGWNWFDEDISDLQTLTLPADGSGSYKIWLMTYPDPNDFDPDHLTFANCAQPMLWGTGTNEFQGADCIGRGEGDFCPPNGQPEDGKTSDQDELMFGDNDQGGYPHTPDDCYYMNYGVCPEPFGSLACFYTTEVVECPGDIDGDGDTDHSDLGELLAAWCSQVGDPNWNPNADLDGDGHVGHGDLGVLLADWGCPNP